MDKNFKFDLQLFGDYDQYTSRTNVASMIPQEVSNEIVKGLPAESVVLSLFKRAPDMTRKQLTLPVNSVLPQAYFTSGDTGLRKTTSAEWTDKYIYAEELNAIVPIPVSVLEDAEYDMWEQIKPLLMQALGKTIDLAAIFGTNKPTNWPTAIVTAATSASNTVTYGTNPDIADDIGGVDGLMSLVEADGYDVNGFASDISLKSYFRGLRSADGTPIFQQALSANTPATLYGQPIFYPKNGGWTKTSALLIAGDFSKAIYSMRKDITYKILDQAVITDSAGAVVINLPQQGMIALMVTMRLGWQVPNPVNALNEVEASRYPFAVLLPAS